ncbi:putative glycerol kinase 5 isoform X3 [Choloepus didactylus]|uniref:putative glycerol kinase 5 isoform X3 n=2 Tax=Choloepus didactylus TaxID=27675 RepID=UPI00189E7358|nr:putative glycerol kinase 5 isoform X3 [Choloepus didactylus]
MTGLRGYAAPARRSCRNTDESNCWSWHFNTESNFYYMEQKETEARRSKLLKIPQSIEPRFQIVLLTPGLRNNCKMKTGNHFHNFISWQDLRAAELVKYWNNSFIMKLIHSSCRVLHFFTRSKRLLAASLFTFTPQHLSLRLAWVLQNLIEVQKAVEEENCCFGTIDTWLLHKLTKGSEYATDFSNASTTGLFDPYEMCWSGFITSLLSIPLSLLPPVRDTSYNFGSVNEEIFGVPIPIVALVADQQSAMFGECCFQTGDVKLTMGTGTFLDINTGNKPEQTLGGFYPLIGWKIGQEVVCIAEGNAGDTGTAIKWAQQLDLFTDAAESEKMAKSLEDSEGVYFVPSFSGLQAPLNDPRACASFMGLKPSTSKYHLVRAILESIAFRNKQLYEMMQKEIRIPVTKVRADGGVCKNGFVMQMTSDLINETIDRPVHMDMSCLGAASLAGLAVGMYGFYKNESLFVNNFLHVAFLLPNHKITERVWKALVSIKLHIHMHILTKYSWDCSVGGPHCTSSILTSLLQSQEVWGKEN